MARKVSLCCLTLMLFLNAVNCQGCVECEPLQGGLLFQNCVTNDSSIVERVGTEVTVNLDVDIASITLEWLVIKRRTYNGKLCGPTIHVKKGDTLKLRLTNSLGNDQPNGEHNKLRMPNTTNIHLHGLHISPEPPGDDVFTRVDPGESHNYTYNIDPDQPPGTYWYHAHWHGSTWFQVMSGMSGLLIVDDDEIPTELESVSCPDNCDNDIHILLQSTLQYIDNADGVSFIKNLQQVIGDHDNFRLSSEEESWLMDTSNNFDHYTVNGLFRPQLTIAKNELKRFRIVNAGGYVGLELEIVSSATEQHACVIKEIAFDGVYLDEPRNQYNNQSYLTVGARVDWLVYCSEPGNYLLRSRSLEANKLSVGEFRRFDDTLMSIVVADSALSEPDFPSSLPTKPNFLDDLTNAEVSSVNKFTLEFANDFYINRKKFHNISDYRYEMEVGTIQEWTLINTIANAPHPIHIHVNHFQVISYNEYTGPISVAFEQFPGSYIMQAQNGNVCNDTYGTNQTLDDREQSGPNFDKEFLQHNDRWTLLENSSETAVGALGYAKKGDWRDVLNLPPLSSVTVRFKVDTYSGPIVAHCHVLKHEDLGMMFTVKATNTAVDNSMIRDLGCQEIEKSSETRIQRTPLYGSILLSFLVVFLSNE